MAVNEQKSNKLHIDALVALCIVFFFPLLLIWKACEWAWKNIRKEKTLRKENAKTEVQESRLRDFIVKFSDGVGERINDLQNDLDGARKTVTELKLKNAYSGAKDKLEKNYQKKKEVIGKYFSRWRWNTLRNSIKKMRDAQSIDSKKIDELHRNFLRINSTLDDIGHDLKDQSIISEEFKKELQAQKMSAHQSFSLLKESMCGLQRFVLNPPQLEERVFSEVRYARPLLIDDFNSAQSENLKYFAKSICYVSNAMIEVLRLNSHGLVRGSKNYQQKIADSITPLMSSIPMFGPIASKVFGMIVPAILEAQRSNRTHNISSLFTSNNEIEKFSQRFASYVIQSMSDDMLRSVVDLDQSSSQNLALMIASNAVRIMKGTDHEVLSDEIESSSGLNMRDILDNVTDLRIGKNQGYKNRGVSRINPSSAKYISGLLERMHKGEGKSFIGGIVARVNGESNIIELYKNLSQGLDVNVLHAEDILSSGFLQDALSSSFSMAEDLVAQAV